MRKVVNILVTGGSGFIGCNFIRIMLADPDYTGRIVNLDALTYAGNNESLADVEKRFLGTRYFFRQGGIRDRELIGALLEEHAVDTVVHFAAESHVDRSISGPAAFMETNIMGTFSLLEVCRERQAAGRPVHFHHVSTDEVYGSLGETGYFLETTAYDPRSPYSASKAASDHLVRAYHHTYGIPVTLSNCSNNYGPYQFPEKVIPLMICNALDGKELPVYGDGSNIRDWLHVEDHARALWKILCRAETGTTYNIGGENEIRNIALVETICRVLARQTGREEAALRGLIRFVKDRPGHDRRYAIDCARIKTELGWERQFDFETGIDATVRWYLDHPDWVASVRSGEYRNWIDKNYAGR